MEMYYFHPISGNPPGRGWDGKQSPDTGGGGRGGEGKGQATLSLCLTRRRIL